MKKLLLAVIGVFGVALAVNDVGKPNTFTANTVAQSSQVNANFDSAYNSINHLKDTTDIKFIRYTDLSTHDSTLPYLALDTIRSNPHIDSMRTGTMVFTGALTASGNVQGDSLVSAKGLRVTNTVSAGGDIITTSGSVQGPTVTGTDSVKSVKGMRAVNNIRAGGSIIGDSVISEKGARITNTATVGALSSSGAVSGTAITGTGKVQGDSLVSDKGARITNHTATATLTASGKIIGDSLVSSKGARVTNIVSAGGLTLSGNAILNNLAELRFKDSGGTERTFATMDGSNVLQMYNSASGGYYNVNSKLVADSLVSAKGLRVTNAISAGGDIVTTSGSVQGPTVTGADSVKSVKGMRAVNNIRAGGSIIGDSVISEKGARITNEVLCASINTGLGSTEVPPYATGTFSCTLSTSGGAGDAIGTANYVISGKRATIDIPHLTVTGNATNITIKGMPAALTAPDYGTSDRPAFPAVVINASSYAIGQLTLDNDVFRLYADAAGSAFGSSGGNGIGAGLIITYRLP